ncbi:hypothetical protein KFE25_014342 [Diacronema lutheri]|uniref:Uncharacterized protein n=2 Tax=Diacronema lutheri TaxID=2081491 RepID=A0A8J5X9E6_DIALT|nr:hypothetical protein KFE25_014342 [Diacronema lutheri]
MPALPATWADLGALLQDEVDDLSLYMLPNCDPDGRTDAPRADGGAVRAGCTGGAAGATPEVAACAGATERAPDPWSLDLVICELCERTVLRSAFAAHTAICVETPADDDLLFAFRAQLPAAHSGQQAVGAALGVRKADAAGSGKLKKQKLFPKPNLAATAAAAAAVSAGARGMGGRGAGMGASARGVGGKGGGRGRKDVPLSADVAPALAVGTGRRGGGKPAPKLGRGRGLGGAAGVGATGGATGGAADGVAHAAHAAAAAERAMAAARAAAAPDPHAAERLRRSEGAMLRAQWVSLVSLLKLPPEAPAPLADRDAVRRQLRPRARVVPLPTETAPPPAPASPSPATVARRESATGKA